MKTICLAALALLSFHSVLAQEAQPDPFAGSLFPPELLMQHQQALGLSEEQKNVLKTELRKVQTTFTERQWALQDEMETLTALAKLDKVDEAQTLRQLDKVLGLEREIKRLQFTMLIRIKNLLTPGQIARLREIAGKNTAK